MVASSGLACRLQLVLANSDHVSSCVIMCHACNSMFHLCLKHVKLLIVYRCLGLAAGLVSEQLQCQFTVSGSTSNAGNKPKPVFDIALSAEVAAPLLDLSKRAIDFVYTHERGKSPQIMVEPLEVRCVG
eukprot:GHUV01054141.1.p1 GENE.GHUV01054141.1~~GHUV01054141.1.p1  ORF type:complete len:129 (-),score=29.15 GHUV01054141.1:69-455(-)